MIGTNADSRETAARGALSRRGFLGRAASLGVAATTAAGPFGVDGARRRTMQTNAAVFDPAEND